MAFENLFIRVERSIGGVQLDSTLEEVHTNVVELTQNPIEAGVDIADHAIVRPKKLKLVAVVSDTPLGVAAFAKIVDDITGLFGTSTSANITRSQQAYNALIALQDARETLTITTRLLIYENMIITEIATSQDKNTSRAAFINMSLEQAIITESDIVSVFKQNLQAGDIQKQASPTVESGKQSPVEVSADVGSSILKKVAGFF